MSTLKEAAGKLIEFIEQNSVYDERRENDSYPDEWRSDEFDMLIDNVKEALKEDDSK